MAARARLSGRARLIELPFDPDLVVGTLRVSWHSFFAFVGATVGGALSIRLSRYLVQDQRVYPFAFAVVAGGLAGARVAHVLDNWPMYAGDVVKMISFAGGGIGTMGAPLGSTVAGFLAAHRLRLPVGFMFDISVIGIALGESIGRIGDIINGEHHGAPCEGLAWCVRYTHPATLGQATSVHPIGLYDALFMLAVFAVLLVYWRRVRGRPPEGRVWAAYLLLLGAGRSIESFFRLDPVVLMGLQQAQVLGLAYAAAGLTLLVALSRRATER
ncbi:MAG TPA: prolipoprotein diacylglyceryl transferase family protein [Candidatus Limnocylindria bacterium]|nr:prolipoprotein diacylglyceryl transferase family protein [Candidatus Limnocylindria bacterium]